jgi:tetratricopeptide (TPR) repeat protein
VLTPVSIIIPAFNQLAYCQACVASLQRCTDRSYELILVDNGSTDGVGPFFDSVAKATVIHTGENLGFAGGVNRGLAVSEGHVVLLNSDTLLSPGWLGRLEAALLCSDDIGMAGPVSNNASGVQQPDGLTLVREENAEAVAQERAVSHQGQVAYVNRLVGFCMMIREEAREEVGLLDERFGIGNFEDDDYCTRVRQAGFKLVVAEDCFVFHHGGKTFSGMGLEGDAFQALMDENRTKYEEKWSLKLPRTSPEDEARRLNRTARQALASGDLNEAMQLLRDAIQRCPDMADNYNDLGVVLWQAEKAELAYAMFQQALMRDRGYEEALDNAGQIAVVLQRGDEHKVWLEGLED